MTDSQRSIITDKLLKMDQYLQELKEAEPGDFADYQTDKLKKYAVERLIQLIIDLALDINNVIIKEKGRPPASDYFNSFIELVEFNVLDQDFAYKIAPSTGLRNRLVHEYEKIDDKIVYDSITKTYDFYIKYMKAISNYLKSKS